MMVGVGMGFGFYCVLVIVGGDDDWIDVVYDVFVVGGGVVGIDGGKFICIDDVIDDFFVMVCVGG